MDSRLANSAVYLSGRMIRAFCSGTCQNSLLLVLPAAFLAQIASALQYLHNHNLVHCDVKAEYF